MKNKLEHIVFIVDSINNLGGGEKSTRELIKILSKKYFIDVLHFSENENYDIDNTNNVNLINLKKFKTRFPRSYISTINLIAVIQITLKLKNIRNIKSIIVGTISSHISFLIIPITKIFCKNNIHIIRDTYLICAGSKNVDSQEIKLNIAKKPNIFFELRRLKFRYNPLRRFLSLFFIKFSTKIVVPSLAMSKLMKLYKIKTFVINNSIETKYEYRPKKFFPEIIKILYPSRFTFNKGMVEVYKLCKKIEKEEKNWQILVTSNKHYALNNLKRFGYSSLPNNLKCLEWLSGENLITEFKNCDIVIYPTICYESFGRVPLEAMSLSKPVITSGAGGIYNLIDHMEDGIIANPRDTNEFFNAINLIVNDIFLYNKITNNGINKVKKLFTYKKLEENYLKIINS